ncbi:YvcK family protein [Candidatus Roizmanbacteria bacterium CG_4_10_14_0_8_um_filter_33_9]|uniref:Putative gluconeogenesis factor n=1 Tax=Candidatus Roizmanbacteria bacterium CG_4_10_14_0_8_um_filter_33_9 TaxID=1974826 RepID=A0A2M7QID4_9BACT|nr:MAG: YvcK family protein [Candidatus Roizmanbacteria bacterium CG_4_10_14_0_8_um_filter_33_9]
MKKITVIGGGTGAYVVLSGLKDEKIDLGVIVNMTDSGGSTGRLRDQLGVLPPGDLRQCLVALSDAPDLWRRLFLYRFESGDFAGHNFGNIFLSALEKVSTNYYEVIQTVSYVLKTKGDVIPVTINKTHLCVEYKNGKILKGEGYIDDNIKENSKIIRAFLEPKIQSNPRAIKRLKESDLIIISPGDLYTSIIPILLVDRVAKTISKSRAKIVYIMNLMTKKGQTTHYKASDHLDELKSYLGREPDWVVINNGEVPKNIVNWYHDHLEESVINNLTLSKNKIIQADIVDRAITIQNKADMLTRSILRHNSFALSRVIMNIIQNKLK